MGDRVQEEWLFWWVDSRPSAHILSYDEVEAENRGGTVRQDNQQCVSAQVCLGQEEHPKS